MFADSWLPVLTPGSASTGVSLAGKTIGDRNLSDYLKILKPSEEWEIE